VTLKLDEDLSSEASCAVKIVISGLDGACVVDADNVLTLSGPARANFIESPTSTLAGKAKWDPDSDSVILYLSTSGGGLTALTPYTFSFAVRNPSAGQESPAISIEVRSRGWMQPNPFSHSDACTFTAHSAHSFFPSSPLFPLFLSFFPLSSRFSLQQQLKQDLTVKICQVTGIPIAKQAIAKNPAGLPPQGSHVHTSITVYACVTPYTN